ncbi:hypothetical protein L3Y34_014275 [Caenorhabditis briggsae]|uniref:Uncharacterized protein n=1 Tax=Caenorhabditis briggsae TaxID=6238 RepID=A0AAE9DQ70_CAEBR|nr:hypothetical protein L3Y34_014275 [Caenorhabditis briggsae]
MDPKLVQKDCFDSFTTCIDIVRTDFDKAVELAATLRMLNWSWFVLRIATTAKAVAKTFNVPMVIVPAEPLPDAPTINSAPLDMPNAQMLKFRRDQGITNLDFSIGSIILVGKKMVEAKCMRSL